MSSAPALPRFLLPQRSAIWRNCLTSQSQSLRTHYASTKATKKSFDKPIVLEKPTKFVPPSHGSKLRKDPPRYPGPNLSAEEQERMKTKKYPHMMPPNGTFMHWFINNRSIHIYIALGTLFTMAATVFFTNFKRESPFADMIPPWTQIFPHPIKYARKVLEVLRLNQAHATAETQERRKRKVEDVAKRSAYRKAHGLDKKEGFGGWMAKTDAELADLALASGETAKEGDLAAKQIPPAANVPKEKKPIKKWLGIW